MIICRSAAKVNLTLDVIGRRPDGYHELSSIVHTVGLWDTIRLEFGQGTHFQCNVPELSNDQNLCIKAVRAWTAAASEAGVLNEGQVWPDVRITLDKRIPIGAGLGGGSGNAAAILLALNQYSQNHHSGALEHDQLLKLAAHLGADVPLFLAGGCALMEGIGERLTPLPTLRGTLLIVKPPESLSTPHIFRIWDEMGVASAKSTSRLLYYLQRSPETMPVTSADSVTVESLAEGLRKSISNDLSTAAERCGVEAGPLVELLTAHGALAASMTGSGSAVFGVFTASDAAQLALLRMRQRGKLPNDYFAAIAPLCAHGIVF